MGSRLSSQSLRKFNEDLRKFEHKRVTSVARDVAHTLNQDVKHALQSDMPTDTGAMRDSTHTVRIEASDIKIVDRVQIKAYYATWVDKGTKVRKGVHFVQKTVESSGRMALRRSVKSFKHKLES